MMLHFSCASSDRVLILYAVLKDDLSVELLRRIEDESDEMSAELNRVLAPCRNQITKELLRR